jgi:hypothetical protein
MYILYSVYVAYSRQNASCAAIQRVFLTQKILVLCTVLFPGSTAICIRVLYCLLRMLRTVCTCACCAQSALQLTSLGGSSSMCKCMICCAGGGMGKAIKSGSFMWALQTLGTVKLVCELCGVAFRPNLVSTIVTTNMLTRAFCVLIVCCVFAF